MDSETPDPTENRPKATPAQTNREEHGPQLQQTIGNQILQDPSHLQIYIEDHSPFQTSATTDKTLSLNNEIVQNVDEDLYARLQQGRQSIPTLRTTETKHTQDASPTRPTISEGI